MGDFIRFLHETHTDESLVEEYIENIKIDVWHEAIPYNGPVGEISFFLTVLIERWKKSGATENLHEIIQTKAQALSNKFCNTWLDEIEVACKNYYKEKPPAMKSLYKQISELGIKFFNNESFFRKLINNIDPTKAITYTDRKVTFLVEKTLYEYCDKIFKLVKNEIL